MKKYFSEILCLIIMAIVIAVSASFATYCVIESPNWSECKIVFQNKNGEETITQDEFLGRVVDLYQSLVNLQISIIAVLLVIGFLYPYCTSLGHVRKVLDEELYSDHFREHYLPIMAKIVTDLVNNNEIQERLQQLDELHTRVSTLEGLDQYENGPLHVNMQLSSEQTESVPGKKEGANGDD